MFYDSGINTIYVGSKWTTVQVTESSSMFRSTSGLPNYNSSYVDKSMAYAGGYLTCASGEICTCTYSGC